MPFPDPFGDDRPAWQDVAEAIEYWVIAALLIGAWICGIVAGLRWLIHAIL